MKRRNMPTDANHHDGACRPSFKTHGQDSTLRSERVESEVQQDEALQNPLKADNGDEVQTTVLVEKITKTRTIMLTRNEFNAPKITVLTPWMYKPRTLELFNRNASELELNIYPQDLQQLYRGDCPNDYEDPFNFCEDEMNNKNIYANEEINSTDSPKTGCRQLPDQIQQSYDGFSPKQKSTLKSDKGNNKSRTKSVRFSSEIQQHSPYPEIDIAEFKNVDEQGSKIQEKYCNKITGVNHTGTKHREYESENTEFEENSNTNNMKELNYDKPVKYSELKKFVPGTGVNIVQKSENQNVRECVSPNITKHATNNDLQRCNERIDQMLVHLSRLSLGLDQIYGYAQFNNKVNNLSETNLQMQTSPINNLDKPTHNVFYYDMAYVHAQQNVGHVTKLANTNQQNYSEVMQYNEQTNRQTSHEQTDKSKNIIEHNCSDFQGNNNYSTYYDKPAKLRQPNISQFKNATQYSSNVLQNSETYTSQLPCIGQNYHQTNSEINDAPQTHISASHAVLNLTAVPPKIRGTIKPQDNNEPQQNTKIDNVPQQKHEDILPHISPTPPVPKSYSLSSTTVFKRPSEETKPITENLQVMDDNVNHDKSGNVHIAPFCVSGNNYRSKHGPKLKVWRKHASPNKFENESNNNKELNNSLLANHSGQPRTRGGHQTY